MSNEPGAASAQCNIIDETETTPAKLVFIVEMTLSDKETKEFMIAHKDTTAKIFLLLLEEAMRSVMADNDPTQVGIY